jgi:hypothetical protein
MRVAHEAPLTIMSAVKDTTDYDYALVHLFEENESYYKFFENSLAEGREVILDNSIFELGKAFNAGKFAGWVKKLKPTSYIVPDVLENSVETIANFDTWNRYFREDCPGKAIGVVQGTDWDELNACYDYMKKNADIIAISFDYSWYEKQFPNEPTKFHSWMKGRQYLLNRLLKEKAIDTSKPHHLLGAGLPQEFAYYKEWDWIDTIDTSNPVVHGIKGIRYKEVDGVFGLDTKESVKLYTMMDSSVANFDDVVYNIAKFKENLGKV